MAECSVGQKPLLKYDMLTTYEQTVLKRRPLKKNVVNSILKTSLRNFLHGNDIVLPPATTSKSKFTHTKYF